MPTKGDRDGKYIAGKDSRSGRFVDVGGKVRGKRSGWVLVEKDGNRVRVRSSVSANSAMESATAKYSRTLKRLSDR